MEIVALVAVLAVSLALVFGLPFGMAQYSYHLLKKKNVPLYWRWTAAVPAIAVLYILALLLLPDRHVYKLDYIEIIAYSPPKNATFFYGQADQYGKHPGDFSFGMHTSPQRYKNILDLIQRRGFAKDSTTRIPDTIRQYLQENKAHVLYKLSLTRYARFNYYADFLSDSSTIFMRKIPKRP